MKDDFEPGNITRTSTTSSLGDSVVSLKPSDTESLFTGRFCYLLGVAPSMEDFDGDRLAFTTQRSYTRVDPKTQDLDARAAVCSQTGLRTDRPMWPWGRRKGAIGSTYESSARSRMKTILVRSIDDLLNK